MKSGSKLLAGGLVFVGLVLVNYLASNLPFRGDATANNLYTLSPGTKAILAKVEEPITLDFYFSRGIEGLPIQYKNYADRVEEMLHQYVRASHGNITLNIINPEPDSDAEEKAARSRLQAQTVPQSGERFYCGLVATLADQQLVIPAFSPQREEFLEYDLSDLIHRVQQVTKPRLGLLTSLPLEGDAMTMLSRSQNQQKEQLIHSEWAKSYDIVKIETDAKELPDNLDALAILHPEGVGDQLQFAIDQFLLGGKPVLIAVDPSSVYFKHNSPQNSMFGGQPPPNTSSDLPTLFKAYGIKYDASQVVGDQKLATQVNNGSGGIARMPIWLSLGKDNFDTSAMPTAELHSMLLAEAGSFTVDESKGLKVTPLLTTSDQAGEMPSYTLQYADPDSISKQLSPKGGVRTLAAIISGKFTTAFPNGKPADSEEKKDGDKADSTPKPSTPDKPALKESSGTSNLILIADTDWLLDDFSVRRMSFFGSEAYDPLNDNLAFGNNTVDFLAGSQDLISLRGKAGGNRPFTVVQDIQVQAQAKYQEQLNTLDNQLSEVQNKLRELQNKSPDGNQLIASPEARKAIEDFQKQEIEVRHKQREIRHALREDIDALENKLIVFNMLASPVLVGFFGIYFYRRRRSK